MAENLFAACRVNKVLVGKRIPIDAAIQEELKKVFCEQEAVFRDGVTNEVPFDGTWKPEEDEFLTIPVPDEAKIFEEVTDVNAVSVAEVDTKKFAEEGIKALFTSFSGNEGKKILVQQFTARQILSRRFALLLRNNAFRQLTDTAFTLDSGLTCIIEGGLIKFKSLHKLRSIIDFREIYREATDQEIRNFAGHPKLKVADVDAFLEATSPPSRKLIKAILIDGTLDSYETEFIQKTAQDTDLEVNVQDGKIVVPTKRVDIRELLRFLTESRYLGPLSGQTYITNSRRPVEANSVA